MKMKHIAAVLTACLLTLLLALTVGATDVTTFETTAETIVETTEETDAATTEEMVAEPTETTVEGENENSGLAFRPDTLKDTLPIMGMGMLGIFLVTGVIVLVITLLNKISNAIDARKSEESDE